ncbi:MAG: PTS sugar transporter subunit IIA [Planctomycetota bacterium]|jgi:mannitol/fructose-specific phosphotransferase system IIA component (Ntr-type)
MSISLENIIPPERVKVLVSTDKESALREISALVTSLPEVEDGERLLEAIFEREEIMSTGIGLGIAIPHAKIPQVKEFVVALGKMARGIEFNALDGQPVELIVLIAGPDDQQERYLQLLARITLKLKDAAVRRQIAAAEGVDAILAALA